MKNLFFAICAITTLSFFVSCGDGSLSAYDFNQKAVAIHGKVVTDFQGFGNNSELPDDTAGIGSLRGKLAKALADLTALKEPESAKTLKTAMLAGFNNLDKYYDGFSKYILASKANDPKLKDFESDFDKWSAQITKDDEILEAAQTAFAKKVNMELR